MSENTEKLHKYTENNGYMITIKKAPGIEKILDNLRTLFKQNSVEFEMLRMWQLKKEFRDPEEEASFIEIESEIYMKLKKLSAITGIPIKDIASAEFGDFFNSVGDIPVIFLDRHLGIENIKNPKEMLEKMDEVINIGSKYLEILKAKDLIKHVEVWHNPLKSNSTSGE